MNDSEGDVNGVELTYVVATGTPSTSGNTQELNGGDSSDEIDAEISRLE